LLDYADSKVEVLEEWNFGWKGMGKSIRRFGVSKSDKFGHIEKIYSIAWRSDNRLLLSAGQDGKLIIWDTYANHAVGICKLKSCWVMSCDYSPSGELIGVGGLDNQCSIYKHADLINAYSNSEESSSRNALDIEPVCVLAGHAGFVTCIKFKNDDTVFTSSGDGTVIEWDITTKKQKKKYQDTAPHARKANGDFANPSDISGISLLPSHNGFASCSNDGCVKLWDARNPSNCVMNMNDHESPINAMCTFPNETGVATACEDGSLQYYDFRIDQVFAAYKEDEDSLDGEPRAGGASAIGFSNSGRLLVAGYYDGRVKVWDTLRCESTVEFPAHGLELMKENSKAADRISALVFSKDGNAFATAGWDCLVKVWPMLK